MARHLNEELRTEAVLDLKPLDQIEHLMGCSACRQEVEELRASLRTYREWVLDEARKEEAFWLRQRHAIRKAFEKSRPGWMLRAAWVCTAILAVTVSAFLYRPGTEQLPPTSADPDHALLLEIEQSIRRDLPQALEPAALLAQEMRKVPEVRANP